VIHARQNGHPADARLARLAPHHPVGVTPVAGSKLDQISERLDVIEAALKSSGGHDRVDD
jgi:hypothetical protein